jgi:hypothetical protein
MIGRAVRVPPSVLRRLSVVVLALAALGAARCAKEEDSPSSPGPRGEGESRGTVRGSGVARPDAQDRVPKGVTLPPPAFRWNDATPSSGIGATNHSGRAGVKDYLVEAVGVGPAWLDYDRDGDLDLYEPEGDVLENYALEKAPDPADPDKRRPVLRRSANPSVSYRDRLWRNDGGGRFTDVAAEAGVADERWSFGSLAWDFDGDGWTDVFVANLGKNRLWRNLGNGRFEDVAEAVGLAGDENEWSTCGACADYDGDGRLDLYVARYADVAAEVERQRVERKLPEGTPVGAIPGRSCKWRGLDAYCGPVGLVPQHDTLYRQTEDGRFRDVSVETGVRPRAAKYGFTSMWFDYDQDGLIDLYVANDSEENFLFKQERDGDRVRFRDVADPLSVKFGPNQNPQASMGAAVADVNRDGLLDIFITNFALDFNNLYIGRRYQAGLMTFRDRGLQVMGREVFHDLAWGCGWYDFDHDGDLDVLIANGHVYKEIDLFERTGTSYDQYPAVFECLDAKNLGFREVGPKAEVPSYRKPEDYYAGDGLRRKCWRGAAFADWDDDGDTDVYLQAMNDVGMLLRNDLEAGPQRRWIRLSLDQGGRNHDAIGATVTVRAEGLPEQMFPVYRCQSFLGTDDPRLLVGVGKAATASVSVVWPGVERKRTEHPDLATGAHHVLRIDGTSAPASPR